MSFTLKPTSKNNVERMRRHFTEPSDELLKMDQYGQWIELLRIIAEPTPGHEASSFDKIDVDEFDVKIAEDALASFMPSLTVTVAGLVGSTRS